MLWVRDSEPHLWQQGSNSLLLPKDYVRLRLSGDKATDVADASGTLLLDVSSRKWSAEMLSATGLDERILPSVHESPGDYRHRLRALEPTPRVSTPALRLSPAAGDQAAGAVGMGVVRPGTVSAIIGTSGVVFAASDRPSLDPKGRVHTFCHAIPGSLACHGSDPRRGNVTALVSGSVWRGRRR